MPTYDYRCEHCGDFSLRRPIVERDQACRCPTCEAPASRVLFAVPMVARLTDETRQAHEVNERSRHEPQSSRDYRPRHAPGCGCCSASSGGATRRGGAFRFADGSRSFPGRRPWQISH